jgi:hypothetical protein
VAYCSAWTSFGVLSKQMNLWSMLHAFAFLYHVHISAPDNYAVNKEKAVNVYSAGAELDGIIFSILANSHSLLHSGHALRVFSHRCMQSK